MRELPITDAELASFLTSPNRVKRLQAIQRFQNHRIVIKVVSSSACICGHKKGDEFVIDAMGRVMPQVDGNGVCMMALHKIWWRVMLLLERMAAADNKDTAFTSKIFDLPMNCYGAGLPLGVCGEILMTVHVREV